MKTFKALQAVIPFTFIFLLAQKSTAQSEMPPPGMGPMMPVRGYIILSNGDTLPGKLKWTLKYVENNPVEIKFRAENGAEQFLNASEIKGFGNQIQYWNDNDPIPESMETEHYVSLPSMKKNQPVFFHRLISGRISVYQNRSSMFLEKSEIRAEKTKFDGLSFSYVPGEGLSIGPVFRTDYRVIDYNARFSSYFVSKDNGALIKVEKNNYEEVFKTLFGDCPGIEKEISNNPDLLKFKFFMVITEIYNQTCQVN